VHLRATLHDGTLTLTVSCADEAARQAVTAALPDLHHQLGALGNLDVQLGGGHAHHDTPHHTTERPSVRDHRPNDSHDAPTEDNGRPRHFGGRRADQTLDRWM
jgi:hypothetical protein